MEQEKIPRIPFDEGKSFIHPSNLFASTLNGIISLEEFRNARPPENPAITARIQQIRERTDAAEEEGKELRTEKINLLALQVKASEDPDQYQKPFLDELVGYHERRAFKFGSHVTALEVEKPRLLKVKRWFAEKKQSYHEKRAKVASVRLAELAFN